MKTLILLCALSTSFAAAAAAAEFDHTHAAWDKVLKRFVDDDGMVNYRKLKHDRTAGLDAYLKALAEIPEAELKDWSRAQLLALYINAYNAYTVKAILDHYPIEATGVSRLRFPNNSIRQIDGVWKKHKHVVAGQRLTLDAMEHKKLREQLQEPRIHFAIVCASIGCPKLARHAFTADALDKQLDAATRRFVNDRAKVRLDRGDGVLHLSRIFKWFSGDFKDTPDADEYDGNGVIAFVARYRPKADAAILRSRDIDVEYLDYDWSLNEQ